MRFRSCVQTLSALAVLGVLALWLPAAARGADPKEGASKPMSNGIYAFTARLNDGTEKPLADYGGKVLLVVNTASECGFTPQYEGLEKLYERFKDRGFLVLAFPANNFGAQEPGTDAQIRAFCSTKFGVTFPLFAKSSVKGPDISPLYRYLTSGAGFDGDITWNFNKFLVGRDGKVLARFDSSVKPDSDELVKAVEKALAQQGGS
jgi:glutathione peroxidase